MNNISRAGENRRPPSPSSKKRTKIKVSTLFETLNSVSVPQFDPRSINETCGAAVMKREAEIDIGINELNGIMRHRAIVQGTGYCFCCFCPISEADRDHQIWDELEGQLRIINKRSTDLHWQLVSWKTDTDTARIESCSLQIDFDCPAPCPSAARPLPCATHIASSPLPSPTTSSVGAIAAGQPTGFSYSSLPNAPASLVPSSMESVIGSNGGLQGLASLGMDKAVGLGGREEVSTTSEPSGPTAALDPSVDAVMSVVAAANNSPDSQTPLLASRVCPQCGTTLSKTAKFCFTCGRKI